MRNTNVWAPWRMQYLKSLDTEQHPEAQGCFLCDYWAHPQNDQQNLVLWRTQLCMVLFNRFPYTGGHMLITPAAHAAALEQLDEATMLEMMTLARDAQTVLTAVIKPQGFNVGINFNRCAGAGLPEHIHMHLVPRWEGDTNFMAVNANVHIISQALDDLYLQLRKESASLNLPTVNR